MLQFWGQMLAPEPPPEPERSPKRSPSIDQDGAPSGGWSALHHPSASIDGLVFELYERLRFSPEHGPRWEAFSELFETGARLVQVEEERVVTMDLSSFIQRVERARQEKGMMGFQAAELARRTDVFGGIAQVFSTYEREESSSSERSGPRRGIVTLQLCKREERWWIASMVWTDEHTAQPIPPTYLPHNR